MQRKRVMLHPKTMKPIVLLRVKLVENQDNIPAPEDMLLNTDAEPDLSQGIVSLFNGKDLSGWSTKGGECKFEAKDGILIGTCVPGSPSTYLSTDRADYRDFILGR